MVLNRHLIEFGAKRYTLKPERLVLKLREWEGLLQIMSRVVGASQRVVL